MRLSDLLSKTSKQAPRDEVSTNSKLLIRAGFIDKVAAGIYTFLPLGQRVLKNISNIVREEMDAIGGQEVIMPVLHPQANWGKTGRWKSFDVLYKTNAASGDFALGPSHEEIVVPLLKRFVSSYQDLPKYVYQIQTKFRDEPRAKSGLLRGREFLMKDLYSFHTDEAAMFAFYEKMKKVYQATFGRMGLETIETKAAGGTFSDFSHEYQVICENGEDEIIYCPSFAKATDGKPSGCHFAENTEIASRRANEECPVCKSKLRQVKTIEVGNIFPLRDKYSKAFGLTYKDQRGKDQVVTMGCYGIGISRAMGAIVEVCHDDRGIIWPRSVAPYQAHLITIDNSQLTIDSSKEVYQKLQKAGVEILWDDQEEVSAGEKFADCDLIGIPVRLVVSKKVGKGKVEWKERGKEKTSVIDLDEVLRRFKD